MGRGENDAFLCCLLHNGTWHDWECMFLEFLRDGESLSLLLTATLSWEILSIMTSCASLCRSSRLCHLRCCNMSPTLDIYRFRLVTYLAALRWIISILSESIRHTILAAVYLLSHKSTFVSFVLQYSQNIFNMEENLTYIFQVWQKISLFQRHAMFA